MVPVPTSHHLAAATVPHLVEVRGRRIDRQQDEAARTTSNPLGLLGIIRSFGNTGTSLRIAKMSFRNACPSRRPRCTSSDLL